jgi:hypothetical protein
MTAGFSQILIVSFSETIQVSNLKFSAFNVWPKLLEHEGGRISINRCAVRNDWS